MNTPAAYMQRVSGVCEDVEPDGNTETVMSLKQQKKNCKKCSLYRILIPDFLWMKLISEWFNSIVSGLIGELYRMQ